MCVCACACDLTNSSHHHPDSFAKTCDICNAKASHSQAAYNAAVAPQTQNSPNSIAALHATENSVIFTNTSTKLNQTATASATLPTSTPIVNPTERGESRFSDFIYIYTYLYNRGQKMRALLNVCFSVLLFSPIGQ